MSDPIRTSGVVLMQIIPTTPEAKAAMEETLLEMGWSRTADGRLEPPDDTDDTDET